MTSRRINFYILDDLNRFVDRFTLFSSEEESGSDSSENEKVENTQVAPNFDVTLNVDGYFLSVLHNTLTSSAKFRKLLIKNLLNTVQNIPAERDVDIRLQLLRPRAEMLDFGWNYRINTLIAEKCELENSMSWLSTLGGAFSALGDNFEHCAKVAGKISVQQMQIALKLGEPLLMARCKLYMALSLIQQKKLKLARKIVEEQYEIAKNYKDFRLINMCKGIWAKLQYTHKLENMNKIKSQ